MQEPLSQEESRCTMPAKQPWQKPLLKDFSVERETMSITTQTGFDGPSFYDTPS